MRDSLSIASGKARGYWMSENPKSEGWWHTVPGLLTALAGIITAVTGLLVALHQTGLFVMEDKAVPQVQVQPPKVPPDSPTPPADRIPTAQKAIQGHGFTFVLDQCKRVGQTVDCQFGIISNQANRKLIIFASSNSITNSGRQFSPSATVQVGPGKVQIGDTIVFMSGVSRQLKITITDVPVTTDMFAVIQLKLQAHADVFSVQFNDVAIEKER